MSSRPTLILLPALPCDAGFYAAQIEALSDLVDPRVLVLEEESLAASAAAILAAAPPRFLLAGTAYGGCLALEVAVRAPERVAGLWLMSCHPGAHPSPAKARQLCDRVLAGEFEAVLREWGEVIVARQATAARERFLDMARAGGPERFARQYGASATRADHWGDLKSITAPTLVLWGEEDRFVSVGVGRRMALALPNAQFVALPGCRHLPPLEQPEATSAAARHWLAVALSGPGARSTKKGSA